MPYFAVAYGHVIRYEKANTMTEAARLAFGVHDVSRTTVRQLPKSPRGLSHTAKLKECAALAVRHFAKTGSIVSGYENEPGIKNVHRTTCTACDRNILTEPASAGVDHTECLECLQKPRCGKLILNTEPGEGDRCIHAAGHLHACHGA